MFFCCVHLYVVSIKARLFWIQLNQSFPVFYSSQISTPTKHFYNIFLFNIMLEGQIRGIRKLIINKANSMLKLLFVFASKQWKVSVVRHNSWIISLHQYYTGASYSIFQARWKHKRADLWTPSTIMWWLNQILCPKKGPLKLLGLMTYLIAC